MYEKPHAVVVPILYILIPDKRVDGEISVVKFENHSRGYLKGLTKFWGFEGSSVPP